MSSSENHPISQPTPGVDDRAMEERPCRHVILALTSGLTGCLSLALLSKIVEDPSTPAERLVKLQEGFRNGELTVDDTPAVKRLLTQNWSNGWAQWVNSGGSSPS